MWGKRKANKTTALGCAGNETRRKTMRTTLRLLIAPFIAVPVTALVIIGLINFGLMATIVGKLIAILVVIWVLITPIRLLISRK